MRESRAERWVLIMERSTAGFEESVVYLVHIACKFQLLDR